MKPISHILKKESPVLLCRELVWRARKKLTRKHLLKLTDKPPRLALRQVGYYRFQDSDISDQKRNSIAGFATEISAGRFPFLGYGTVDLGFPPQWNRDFVAKAEWPQTPVLLRACIRHDGSDVKVPYELSRLQFLPILGKAHKLTGNESYRESAKKLVSDWILSNPVGVGVNWTVAMEAALRAMSICFLLDLMGPIRPDEQRWLQPVVRSLWEHLVYVEAHNEFSHLVRSNHYLSNIVGLYCLSVFLEGEGMKGRRDRYKRLIQREILHQVYEDGGDHEGSTGYHVLVTQLFTSAMLLMRTQQVNVPHRYVERLQGMYQFLAELSNPAGELPMIGDCDDGRVELLSDDLQQMITLSVEKRNSLRVPSLVGIGSALFGASQGTADDASWYGLEPTAQTTTTPVRRHVSVFPQSGIAMARKGDAEVVFCATPNGIRGKGSHTHNDKLGVVLRIDGQELLGDSGTCCYTRDAATRNRFRMTASHNTIVVDNLEQNKILMDTNSLFILSDDAAVSSIEHVSTEKEVALSASHFGYRAIGVTHSRRVRVQEQNSVILEDVLVGGGHHTIEANFHIDPAWEITSVENLGKSVRAEVSGPRRVSLEFSAPAELHGDKQPTQISRTFGSSIPASKIHLSAETALPFTLTTRITWQ